MTKVVALYARVSRDDLHCENQVLTLVEWAKREGIKDYEIHSEMMSSRKHRPIKEALLARAILGDVGTIVCARVDRWGRSITELSDDYDKLKKAGVRMVFVQLGLDTGADQSTSTSNLMFNTFGSFAQFERDIISERTKDGLARVRAEGRRLGRPSTKPRCSQCDHLESRHKRGTGCLNNDCICGREW